MTIVGIASLEIDNGNTTLDFDCSQVGANTVTLTVADVNGNVSTCDAIVTVEDTERSLPGHHSSIGCQW